MTRYTSHELTILAKQNFRQTQRAALHGGVATDYIYRGWQILVNGSFTVLLVNYDFRNGTIEERSNPIHLIDRENL